MDDVRFDALTRALSRRIGRRSTLGRFLAIGGVMLASAASTSETEAARRGFSGPKLPHDSNDVLCSLGADTCHGGVGCNGGTGFCMPGYDTPDISYCVTGMLPQYGRCGSCQTHFDCLLLTGDDHSPCLARDLNCQDCTANGGACGQLTVV